MSSKEVENLKEQLEFIRKNYLDLLNNQNEGFIKAANLIHIESDKRIRLLKENREKELAAAHKAYESQIECIDSDYEREFAEVQKQVSKIMQFRIDSLGDEFPEARNEILKYDTPLKAQILAKSSTDKHQKAILSFQESDEPLLTKKEISEDFSKISSTEKPYQISNGVLTCGKDIFNVGTNCSLMIGKHGPLIGAIHEIRPYSFYFAVDGSNQIEIPLQSLNMGLAKLVL